MRNSAVNHIHDVVRVAPPLIPPNNKETPQQVHAHLADALCVAVDLTLCFDWGVRSIARTSTPNAGKSGGRGPAPYARRRTPFTLGASAFKFRNVTFRNVTIPQLLVPILYLFSRSRPFSVFCLGGILSILESSMRSLCKQIHTSFV